VPGVVPKLSATPGDFDGGGPALGEHTDEVLRDVGYDAAAIADLRRRGVI
jgi:formyl-CoA transferase